MHLHPNISLSYVAEITQYPKIILTLLTYEQTHRHADIWRWSPEDLPSFLLWFHFGWIPRCLRQVESHRFAEIPARWYFSIPLFPQGKLRWHLESGSPDLYSSHDYMICFTMKSALFTQGLAGIPGLLWKSAEEAALEINWITKRAKKVIPDWRQILETGETEGRPPIRQCLTILNTTKTIYYSKAIWLLIYPNWSYFHIPWCPRRIRMAPYLSPTFKNHVFKWLNSWI